MYFARRILLVLFGFGIFAGFGSAAASARWHARHGGGCDGRWNGERYSERWNRNSDEPNAVVAPAPVTTPVQNVVVPSAPAPAAAPAPQVFVITVPSGAAAPAAAPQIITVPVPMPAAAPAPAPAAKSE
jgi:hypothetical protein